MNPLSFEEAIEQICAEDSRYDAEAYRFVRDALDYTIRLLEKPKTGMGRHVSGQELLGGIRQYALSEYGPMTLRVLRTWGLRATEDFGEIIFNLVDLGVLGRTDEDNREDFAGGYEFEQAFAAPFRPASRARSNASPDDAPVHPPPGHKKGEST